MTCLTPLTLHKGTDDERVVPCGKCMACKANRRAEWIIRLRAELEDSDFALFVTLTNDDAHLHYVDVVNSETGEVTRKQAPNKREIQLFLKRVRKVIGNEHMRYFIVSEYGDRTQRCHYHGLFFFKEIKKDSKLYDTFTNEWKNGFIKFGDVTPASITYCTKYVLKISALPFGINDNFMLCSRRPAIGSKAILQQIEVENYPKANISQICLHGTSARLPRLFRDKMCTRYEDDGIDTQEFKDELRDTALRMRLDKYKKWKADNPTKNMCDFLYAEYENQLHVNEQLKYHIKQQNLF